MSIIYQDVVSGFLQKINSLRQRFWPVLLVMYSQCLLGMPVNEPVSGCEQADMIALSEIDNQHQQVKGERRKGEGRAGLVLGL